MTDYTTVRDDLTTILESDDNIEEFYVDSRGHLNFGYGIDVTANIPSASSNTDDNPAIDAIVASLSADENVSSATVTAIQNTLNSYNDGDITAASAETTLNNLINSGLSEGDLETDTGVAMDLFYANDVVPYLQRSLHNYNNLTQTAQLALQSIVYNSGSGSLGSSIRTAIANSDYASAAYQLAFNTATPDNNAYSDRALVSAAEMLGFIPAIDGSHNITGLTATSDVNNQTIVKFFQEIAANNPSDYLSTTPVADFISNLKSYLTTQGVAINSDGNDVQVSVIPTSYSTDSSGSTTFNNQLANGQAVSAEVDAGDDNSTVSSGGLVTTISNLENVSYVSSEVVLEQDTNSAANNVTITSIQGGVTTTETINAASDTDLTTDTLTFEGQSIAGNLSTSATQNADGSYTDQYGRTYALDTGTNTLTITGATSDDQLTITNFQSGDFGVALGYAFTSSDNADSQFLVDNSGAFSVSDAAASEVVAVSPNGQVSVLSVLTVNPISGGDSITYYLNNNGTVTQLPPGFNGDIFRPTGVNDEGEVVGDGYGGPFGQRTSTVTGHCRSFPLSISSRRSPPLTMMVLSWAMRRPFFRGSLIMAALSPRWTPRMQYRPMSPVLTITE